MRLRTRAVSMVPTDGGVAFARAILRPRPGHGARVCRAVRELGDAWPAVAVAGAPFNAVGLAASAAQGRAAADRVLAEIGAP